MKDDAASDFDRPFDEWALGAPFSGDRPMMRSRAPGTLCWIPLVLACSVAAPGHAQDGLPREVAKLRPLAEAGDTAAQFRLGVAYDFGRGVRRNGKEAMRWYLAAAEQGHPEAQNSVGSGLQAEERYAEALRWYERASGQNHAHATNNLAYLYDLGLGVAQDRQRAFDLYSRAAELGWAEAMWNLSQMYAAGQLGGPPDPVSACIWGRRAERFARPADRQLLDYAARIIPTIERGLSGEQRASCREQAQDWSPASPAAQTDRHR